jgi:hypothetical protein
MHLGSLRRPAGEPLRNESATFTPASASGDKLATVWHFTANLWIATASASARPRLQLSVEVRTGLRVNENGTLEKLSQAEWLDRVRRLEQLGGPCDVSHRDNLRLGR